MNRHDKVAHWKTNRCTGYASITIAVVFLLVSLLSCSSLSKTSRWRMDGYSMEPNLTDGQFVNVEEVNLTDLQRGDLIIFEWDDGTLLKRLIALPGETVEVKQGHILINGQIYKEPYEVVPPDYEQEPLKLGKDEYFVLGDNRNKSADSHAFGPIKGNTIIGRVVQ
jgi:signal peptidase I